MTRCGKIELTNSPDDLSLNKNIILKRVETFVFAKSICCFLVFAIVELQLTENNSTSSSHC